MKQLLFLFSAVLFFGCASTNAQQNLNKKGFMAEGYDVTEYFNNKAVKGSSKYTSNFEGAKYQFVSEANKNKFDASPAKFQPQYGGYCAYAIGVKAEKVSINPKSFEIIDGKLYLFYDNFLIDTKQKWNEEGASELKVEADKNWKTIKAKEN